MRKTNASHKFYFADKIELSKIIRYIIAPNQATLGAALVKFNTIHGGQNILQDYRPPPSQAQIPAPQTIQVFLEVVDVTTTHYINNIIQNIGLQCRIISIYSN